MLNFTTRIICSSLLILCSWTSLAASERATEAWQRIKDGAMIVDVRTPSEYESEHLDNAINIPLNTVVDGFKNIDKKTNIVLYCRSGSRSGQALSTLDKKGFTNLFNGGGVHELLAAKPE
jgi:phage shock protein E